MWCLDRRYENKEVLERWSCRKRVKDEIGEREMGDGEGKLPILLSTFFPPAILSKEALGIKIEGER
jgi:hypothetical protein